MIHAWTGDGNRLQPALTSVDCRCHCFYLSFGVPDNSNSIAPYKIHVTGFVQNDSIGSDHLAWWITTSWTEIITASKKSPQGTSLQQANQYKRTPHGSRTNAHRLNSLFPRHSISRTNQDDEAEVKHIFRAELKHFVSSTKHVVLRVPRDRHSLVSEPHSQYDGVFVRAELKPDGWSAREPCRPGFRTG